MTDRTASAIADGIREIRLELDRLVETHATPAQKVRWLADELALGEANLERLGIPPHLRADVAEATQAAHAALTLIAQAA